MIYEVRTYTLEPGTVPQFEESFSEALPHREKYSPLAAFWHTDIGTLNQVVHVWGYEDLLEREKIRAEAAKDPNWPPRDTSMIMTMESEIWNPASFMRPLGGGQELGNVYEMRVYTYKPGSIPELLSRWEKALPWREQFSPCVAAMHSELGGLNRWMHIWPYKDLNHRDEIRKASSGTPNWPSGAPGRIRQENKILIPASFSPMR